MDVFFTIDAEVSSPFTPDWRRTCLAWEIRRDIWGETPDGEFGIPYQLEALNRHGLRATVFVEALFASATGPEPLRRIVNLVRGLGHDVQLHIHTEWLARAGGATAPDCIGRMTEAEQEQVLARGLENLRAAGVAAPCAFRAGNYGADNRTLRVLARGGIRFDSSYNRVYLGGDCGIAAERPVVDPRPMEGIVELPVTCFRDWPGHFRHAQLCACSAAELRHVLSSAERRGLPAFVIVSHGFELLKRARRWDERPRVNRMLVERLDALCEFLARNRGRFRSRTFSDVQPHEFQRPPGTGELASWPGRTAWRMVEQVVSEWI